MNTALNLSGKELRLLDTAVKSQINHCQVMVDDFKKEMEAPDCLEYMEDLVDLEKDWGRKKKEYEELHMEIKTQIVKQSLESFRAEKTKLFRRIGKNARLYSAYIGSRIREAFSGCGESQIRCIYDQPSVCSGWERGNDEETD